MEEGEEEGEIVEDITMEEAKPISSRLNLY